MSRVFRDGKKRRSMKDEDVRIEDRNKRLNSEQICTRCVFHRGHNHCKLKHEIISSSAYWFYWDWNRGLKPPRPAAPFCPDYKTNTDKPRINPPKRGPGVMWRASETQFGEHNESIVFVAVDEATALRIALEYFDITNNAIMKYDYNKWEDVPTGDVHIRVERA